MSTTEDRTSTGAPAGARLREATPADGESIAQLVRELAEYEREPQAATATGDDFARTLQEGGGVGCLLAEVDGPAGVEVAGMALWYTTFSTWQGRRGMWLEDLYVRPQHRRRGIARAFFGRLGELCAERGYGRLEWWVLDWNTPAQDFYRTLGARPEDEWTVWRLDGEGLAALAPQGPATGS
ncbi:GNAT family N-acetyltransferase [Kineococcus arenarius]|uniref:GNAT family N-acetyltransferase n=1 Tax=unclassified Kineococcus TaxID=2621656 RepID=UPI003D7C3EF8